MVVATAVGTLAVSFIGKRFPEFSKRNKERELAAKKNDSFQDSLVDVGNKLSRFLPAKAEDEHEYRDKLAQAGLRYSPETWNGIRLLVCAVVGCLGLLLFVPSDSIDPVFKLLLSVGSFVAGWYLPSLFLWALAGNRREEIDKELPSTLELLALSVKAGYPLSHGIKLVGQVGEGELAKEFRTVDADVNLLGMDIDKALDRMQKRCGTESVSAFCAAVIQAQRQGTSITRILGSQAKMARDAQYARTMEKINSLANKMTPIVILVFVPLIVVVVLVPSFVNIIGQLGSF